MISQKITAILLAIPLITMAIPSIYYWSRFRKKSREKSGKKAMYNKIFLGLLAGGFFCAWVVWIGSCIFLFLNKFYSIFGFLTFSTHIETALQISGVFIFYIGAITYNLNIIVAGEYLAPATSPLLKNHKLIQKGAFGIIRHPQYVSYIFILTGLSLILFTYWLFIPTLCVIIGIYPTAKAEEELLIKHFGEEYLEYQRKVGMFFPKLF